MYYLYKIKRHLINWIEYIREHLVRVFVVFIIITGTITVFTFLPKQTVVENEIIKSQNIIVLGITLSNWWTCFNIFGIIVTAIFAMYQFDKTIARKQHEKSAEISKIAAESLMYKCSILGNVIIKSELNDLFNFDLLKPSTFKNFDNGELFTLLNNNDFSALRVKRIYYSRNLQQIYFRMLEMNITQKTYNDLKDKTYTDEQAQKLFMLDNKDMPFKFIQLIASVLNDFEYISMYIASQNAHSKYIYQSLHQFYIKTIKMLGPYICVLNKDYSDKYYTNIIHVYNEWCTLRDMDLKNEKKKKEKVNKILNPKIKMV